MEATEASILVAACGFWSAGLAAQLVPALQPLLHKRNGSGSLILDLAKLRPLRDEGQAAFKALFSLAFSAGVQEVIVRGPSALTRLQMLRIAREVRGHEHLRIESAATSS